MGELMVEVQGRDQTSVVIEDLVSSVQYRFQVVAIAVLGGMEFVGERSDARDESTLVLTTAPPSCARGTNYHGSVSLERYHILYACNFLEGKILASSGMDTVGCAISDYNSTGDNNT